jgi:hypothetical protein
MNGNEGLIRDAEGLTSESQFCGGTQSPDLQENGYS